MKQYNKIAISAKDLGNRTRGEELWIARKAAGLTQVEAARRTGLGENAYLAAEKDRNPARINALRRISRVRAPSLAALLALARRRSGLGLEAVARSLGVSRVTIHAMEGRADAVLREFWRIRGFKFPVTTA